mmetsp:Transcript_19688/g.49432  ORF Transcript_19688/g.49432 Transcript_19688/m.49432 type:complete len:624 (+) Transcript_19688:134-2005(+)|eukprot:CAMPEP_0179003144 /NCGR_PEP_ID=MMETSP0795-20121207/12475_1 /TAXON_ID=88552 /ORGANISM="Amoebophrya sp., Strain Ameob2" /LENGTH=623 /DNA_ID=CAMNT_0020697041 /DNA_START=63 /DNA_END=1934 /DNA_ORIENTATION=+
MAAGEALELQAVIGFKGTVPGGLVLHPDNEHLIFPLGCTVVVRNVIQRAQSFLQGHDNDVSCITISPSGQLMASGQSTFMGFTADIIVWDFYQRKERYRLNLHKVEVKSLCFACNEAYLGSLGGQDDNSLVIWDMANGSAVCGTPAGNDSAHCVKFMNNDPMKLVTAGNYHVTSWRIDLENKKIRPTPCALGQLKRQSTNLVIDANDEFAYCGTKSGDLLQISLARCLFKRTAGNKKNFPQGITASLMLNNGDIICGTGAGLLVKFSSSDLSVRAISKEPLMGGVTSLAKTADNTHVFVGTDKANMYWVNLDNFKAELRNSCHFERINAVKFAKHFSRVFVTSSCSDIRVWDAAQRQELLRIQVPNVECHAIDFSHDGSSILTGWSDGKIRAFLPQSGRLSYVINDAHRNGCTAIACTTTGTRLVSGGTEGEVRVWRLGGQSQSMEGSLKEHRGRVWCIQLTKDDKRAFTSSSDGSCILWDLDNKTRSLCLFESTQFKAMSYHPDQSQILTTGTDRKITYWDTFDGQAIRVLEGSIEGELATLDMSASGSHFVSGSQDRMVKLWDYDLGMSSHVGVGHSGTINGVAIAPDQSFIVSVGAEGAIFIWKTPEEAKEKMNDLSQLD